MQVSGENPWRVFRNEIGKHVVQRCPETERGSRRHTSVIAVGVLPLFDYRDQPLRESDLETITQRKGGPGGQHRNKTDSAVRMKHIPTGLTVFIDGRDQSQNKSKALQILTSKVNNHYYEQAQKAHSANRKEQIGNAGRSDKIRTYNFIDSRVVDHRLGKKTTRIKEIMKGNLDELLG